MDQYKLPNDLYFLSVFIYNSSERTSGYNNDINTDYQIVNTTSSPNTLLPQFMLNETMYYLSGKKNIKADIDESGITGRISSAVSLNQSTSVNGQTNFYVVGTPYVEYNDGYIVLWNEGGAEYTDENDRW